MIDKALFLVYNIIVVMSEDITGYMPVSYTHLTLPTIA